MYREKYLDHGNRQVRPADLSAFRPRVGVRQAGMDHSRGLVLEAIRPPCTIQKSARSVEYVAIGNVGSDARVWFDDPGDDAAVEASWRGSVRPLRDFGVVGGS